VTSPVEFTDILRREKRLIERIREGPVDQEIIRQFRELVLSYYAQFGRDLPWRHTTDPYAILVAELMLQQTQVERVKEKYPEFLGRFPGFERLADAPLSEILAVWQGLGYNRRALSLQKIARIVVSDHRGVLPRSVAALTALPGIGRATASAIVTYAFNEPVIYIETNIRRVFIHFFFRDRADIPDAEIEPLVEAALHRENPRLWYNALMDYGTDLKRRTPNPNRRSAHYTVQKRFEGSDRQIRGAVLRTLLESGGTEEETLLSVLDADSERVLRILQDLEAEGFVVRKDGGWRLREE
jgi:A/G-specific adenine glycosylase